MWNERKKRFEVNNWTEKKAHQICATFMLCRFEVIIVVFFYMRLLSSLPFYLLFGMFERCFLLLKSNAFHGNRLDTFVLKGFWARKIERLSETERDENRRKEKENRGKLKSKKKRNDNRNNELATTMTMTATSILQIEAENQKSTCR